MESLNRRHNGKTGNCPAQLPVTNEGSSALGCMWVPLSARIVSLMFTGLFIYLAYISFFQHSAVRFIIELYVHNLDVPLGVFCGVVWLCQLSPQRCGGLRGCPWNNQIIECVCQWNSVPESQICLILVLPSSPLYLYCEFLLIEKKEICPPIFFLSFSIYDRIQIMPKYLWKFLPL